MQSSKAISILGQAAVSLSEGKQKTSSTSIPIKITQNIFTQNKFEVINQTSKNEGEGKDTNDSHRNHSGEAIEDSSLKLGSGNNKQ